MLIASNYILNQALDPQTIHPWLVRWKFKLFLTFGKSLNPDKSRTAHLLTPRPRCNTAVNNISHSQRLVPITVPDVDTSELSEDVKFSMSAGDFLEVSDLQTSTLPILNL